MDDFIVTMEDLRKCAMCASGVRRWFLDNNLDFKDFLQNGISAEKLLTLNDALADRAVALTRERRIKAAG
ncbi:hypothetical protein WKW50_16495 [Ochrobactrum sp. GPK 3]